MPTAIPPAAPAPLTPARAPLTAADRQRRFHQIQTQASQANLAIRTREGDLVTISAASLSRQSLTGREQLTPTAASQEYTLASLDRQNLSLTVQGDLSPEELKDIATLVGDLTSIAGQFFSGQHGEAIAQALSLEMGDSLGGFTASFSRTTTMASQSTLRQQGHPLPANSLAEAARQSMPAPPDSPSYAQQLQGRWQQIRELLDRQPGEQPASPDKAAPGFSADRAGRRMMDRLSRTIATHPRLSPFAAALGEQAIDRAADHQPGKPPPDRSSLRQAFRRQLDQWLTTA